MAEVSEHEWTEAEVRKRLAALEPLSERQRREIVCTLVGHSRIQTYCWGYYACARCGAQVGDKFRGIYSAGSDKAVIVGHDCEVCRENYEECTWKDKLLAPDPFAKAEEVESRECFRSNAHAGAVESRLPTGLRRAGG